MTSGGWVHFVGLGKCLGLGASGYSGQTGMKPQKGLL